MIRFAPTLTRLGVLMAHPGAFVAWVCYVATWIVSVIKASTGNRLRRLRGPGRRSGPLPRD
jgi:hypothetical protein